MNEALTIVTTVIGVSFYLLNKKFKSDKDFLERFNTLHHIELTENEHAKRLIRDKGKAHENFLNEEYFTNHLSIEEHSDLIKGLDQYQTGDIASVREAKRISKERGYVL